MADYPYRLDKKLIIIPVFLYGRRGRLRSEFVLDTGASGTIIDHSLADTLGYSARDGMGRSSVSSVVGQETGYRLVIDAFEALGKKVNQAEVRCHDLIDFNQVEGLIGMAFLEQFDWCLHPKRQIISVQ